MMARVYDALGWALCEYSFRLPARWPGWLFYAAGGSVTYRAGCWFYNLNHQPQPDANQDAEDQR